MRKRVERLNREAKAFLLEQQRRKEQNKKINILTESQAQKVLEIIVNDLGEEEAREALDSSVNHEYLSLLSDEALEKLADFYSELEGEE